MTAWSQKCARSKEAIMIICLVNNKSRLSAGALIWGNAVCSIFHQLYTFMTFYPHFQAEN